MTTRSGVLALTVIALATLSVALYLSLQPVPSLEYQVEWVKSLLQAGVIAVLGVVTSVVLESFKIGLQRVRDQSKIRFDVRADIARVYMDVKLIRRRAQSAKSIAPDDVVKLNVRQVKLELHKYNSTPLFHSKEELEAALSQMEKYLNRVANKPQSEEHRRFAESEGFRTFSLAFRRAMAVMQYDMGVSHR